MPRTFTRSYFRQAERPPRPSYEIYMQSRAADRRLQRQASYSRPDSSGREGALDRLWAWCTDRLGLAGDGPGPQCAASVAPCSRTL
jgi:hypothetical protein